MAKKGKKPISSERVDKFFGEIRSYAEEHTTRMYSWVAHADELAKCVAADEGKPTLHQENESAA